MDVQQERKPHEEEELAAANIGVDETTARITALLVENIPADAPETKAVTEAEPVPTDATATTKEITAGNSSEENAAAAPVENNAIAGPNELIAVTHSPYHLQDATHSPSSTNSHSENESNSEDDPPADDAEAAWRPLLQRLLNLKNDRAIIRREEDRMQNDLAEFTKRFGERGFHLAGNYPQIVNDLISRRQAGMAWMRKEKARRQAAEEKERERQRLAAEAEDAKRQLEEAEEAAYRARQRLESLQNARRRLEPAAPQQQSPNNPRHYCSVCGTPSPRDRDCPNKSNHPRKR